jgi:hypothetical protein
MRLAWRRTTGKDLTSGRLGQGDLGRLLGSGARQQGERQVGCIVAQVFPLINVGLRDKNRPILLYQTAVVFG